jgi:hypothetical protein
VKINATGSSETSATTYMTTRNQQDTLKYFGKEATLETTQSAFYTQKIKTRKNNLMMA